jgi:hypothetical protein
MLVDPTILTECSCSDAAAAEGGAALVPADLPVERRRRHASARSVRPRPRRRRPDLTPAAAAAVKPIVSGRSHTAGMHSVCTRRQKSHHALHLSMAAAY